MSEKRNIFEDVTDQTTRSAKPQGGMIDRGNQGARRGIHLWLGLLFGLVVMMVFVGGLTRLTDSGLSITEWQPVTGALPPLNAADWAIEFDKYQQIPEFKEQNSWMELSDFKAIYWWEWGHRQLGRVIGLVWTVGFAGFLFTRSIPTGWVTRLLWPGVLGAMQGAIGWWMVSSGLDNGALNVASYRLAIHLGLAFVILGLIAWYMLMLSRPDRDLFQARRYKEKKLYGIATGWLHLAFLQILLGALVAGIDAGRSFTDWPFMGGSILPEDFWMFDLGIRNLFENPGFVQFVHRLIAYLLLGFGLMAWLKGRKTVHQATRRAFLMAFLALCAQVILGIMTVTQAAPVQLAISHQFLAVFLWILILRARFLSQYPATQSIRGV